MEKVLKRFGKSFLAPRNGRPANGKLKAEKLPKESSDDTEGFIFLRGCKKESSQQQKVWCGDRQEKIGPPNWMLQWGLEAPSFVNSD